MPTRLRLRSQGLGRRTRSFPRNVRAPPVRRRQGSGRCCFIREWLAGMATCTLRGLAVAGGGESSESEDDGWEIGYLDRADQVAQEAFCFVLFFDRTCISNPLA